MFRPLAGLAAAGSLFPAAALACGGFFCSTTPVDQSAERILFVQEDPETVSAYVEIMYQGEPEGFAWIVPVPEVPELDVWFGQAFNALDLVTAPQFQGNFGCFNEADGAPQAGGADPDGDDAVDVLAREQVGPFDTVTLTSEDPRALVQWLRENGYRILPEMEPFVALYTAEGMKFVAMKLLPGEDVASIQPIKMTYRAQGPAVPLRLTAVAAQLEMGVKVWVLSDKRYGVANMPAVAINDADLQFDPWTGQTNYVPLVARSVDAAGGHGFVTELATPTAGLAQQVRDSFVPDFAGEEGVMARDALADLLASKPYLTRLYTRVSPEEMDLDPLFVPVEGGDVSNVHIIPERPGQDACGGGAEAFDACAFSACGAAGICGEVAPVEDGARAQAGCACAEGAIARAVPDPTAVGGIGVACGDARMNFTAPERGGLEFPDACAGDPCGEGGECLSLNGFQACRCDAGFLAIGRPDAAAGVLATCVPARDPAAIDLTVVELREPNLPYPGRVAVRPAEPQVPVVPGNGGPGMAAPRADDGCSAQPGGRGVWWAALLPLLALRRRSR